MANDPGSRSGAKLQLALSRTALLEQLSGRPAAPAVESSVTADRAISRASVINRFPWVAVAQRVGQHWWRRHPVNAASHLARPLVERYAQQQPYKLVAIAAGCGAAISLIKPWRLLSVTALLGVALKTSDIADVITTLMQQAPGSVGPDR